MRRQNMKGIGNKIKALRISLGMSQEQLAEELELSSKSIYRYESGKSIPKTYELCKLATFFDVSTDFLLGIMGYKDQLNEIEFKISQNGEYNEIYAKYLDCKKITKIDESLEYYWIHSDCNEIGGQTEWCGWTDETCAYEIRKLRLVKPIEAYKMCVSAYEKPMVLNCEEDAMIFRIYGGQAIVATEICKKFLPEYLEDFIVKCKESSY